MVAEHPRRLMFSNTYSHVEMRKRQNSEKKNDSRGRKSILKLRF